MLRFCVGTVVAGLATATLTACGDNTPIAVACPPESIPVTTDDCAPVCSPDGTWTQVCCGDPPAPPGCGRFVCQQGSWQYDPGSCFACPPAPAPSVGARCEEGARCAYPTACGVADAFDCVAGRWVLSVDGCCNDENPPVAGSSCPASITDACTVACDATANASLTFACAGGHWGLLAHGGNSPSCCALLQEPSACAQLALCRWDATVGCQPASQP